MNLLDNKIAIQWYLVPAIAISILLLICAVSFAEEIDTTKAVIHHTDSGDVSAATIDQWHKERGWNGIGYHFIIRTDGTIEEGRAITKRGAHARGRNNFVGIALCGREDFTKAQTDSLTKLLEQIGVQSIERHHENCPGEGLDIEKIQIEILK